MSGQWHGGKGSRPRPLKVSQEEFGASMDRIFGSRDEERARKQKEKEEYFAKLKAETDARLAEANAINEISKLVAEETLQATEPKAEDNK